MRTHETEKRVLKMSKPAMLSPEKGQLPEAFQRQSLAFKAMTIIVGSLFLATCSRIEVHMVPVPMTMQTFGIVLLGAVLGWRLALGACVTYLLEAAVGLPVLAGGASGMRHFFGPTGGYLIAFPIAATLVGWLAERGWTGSIWKSFSAMLAGHAVILVLGTAYLAGKIGLEKAIIFGLVPFLLGSLLKSALATAVTMVANRWHVGRK
jgi:biotin transport system substrate-specific component